MSYRLCRLVLLSLASGCPAAVEGVITLTTQVVTTTVTSSSTATTLTAVETPGEIVARDALASIGIATHSLINQAAASAGYIPPSLINGAAASAGYIPPSPISGGAAPWARPGFVPPSATNGVAAPSVMATGGVAGNDGSVSNIFFYGNSTLLPPDPPAPDWNVSANDLALPPTIPELPPQPTSDAATAQLIRTVQDNILQNYEIYSTLSCFQLGDTFDCKGPWLYADTWDKSTLPSQVKQNTALQPSYYCSSDSTYLQSADFDRKFYGFTATNLTGSLQSMANYTALWAAGACTSNSSCAAAYQNNTEQMYSDFLGYIQSGFFDFMTAELRNDSVSYCPLQIKGAGSLITYATSYFDGSKEYFGMHNPIFVDGVAELINGTMQEARLELGLSMANNAKRAEGVFLNMIFFTPLSTTTRPKRSVDEEEVYPGCTRKEYVMKGSCDGVLPPREYDLAGEFIPMKDRDRMEVLGLTARDPKNTGLVLRDSSCDAHKSSIASTIKDVQAARLIFSVAMNGLAIASLTLYAIEVGATAGVVASGIIYALGLVELGWLAFISSCQPFNTCDGIPPVAIDTANVIAKAQAGIAAKKFFEQLGVKNLINLLENVISGGTGTLANADALAAGGAGVVVGLGGALIDKLLSNAQKYYEGALKCCQANCVSSICTQAGLKCMLAYGDQWSGSGSLRCGAT